MIINGVEIQKHQLSYDKIIKNTLAQSNELTIRFINGLFGDDIPLDATVEWLDKESVSDKHTAIVADFYPRIDGKMYAIEVEQDGQGDMAVRVFKYTVGGAMLHSMTATKAELYITFPQPCVIFLNSSKNTPQELTWNIEFFDGQKVAVKVPTLHLADLSVKEIAERDLFPIGQFYLRTFGTLTEDKVESFRAAAESLLMELKKAADREVVPIHVVEQMQETVRKIIDNITIKSEKEVGFIMTTNITETLPWIDYRELYEKLEERGRAEGEAKGRAARDMEIAQKAFEKLERGRSVSVIVSELKEFGISDEIIDSAREEAEASRPKRRSAPER
jgi:hypothetical protein